MKIEIGKSYRTVRGGGERIAGYAKCPPIDGKTIFYTNSGIWYTEDGCRVGVLYPGGQPSLYPLTCPDNLIEENHETA
jgi:hypothetical protein